jgi:hypothetical protein
MTTVERFEQLLEKDAHLFIDLLDDNLKRWVVLNTVTTGQIKKYEIIERFSNTTAALTYDARHNGNVRATIIIDVSNEEYVLKPAQIKWMAGKI